jgi:crotonobetainyl-CoA:carnitine CoA-transferase CaiB-like acyl-CoA transferase
VAEQARRARAPLEGTRVVSVGHTLPGLYCLALLRDLGASVLRIERPARAGGETAYAGLAGAFPTRSLTAGTDTLALDLGHPRGRDVFLRLVEGARVVVEGFRPGVAARLGIDYTALSQRQPGIVYAAVSGYGQSGPRSERAGHDINYLAETGVLALTPPPGPPGVAFADGLAGLAAALNILGALLACARGGPGCFLDLAIVDGPLFLMASEIEHHFATGESRRWSDSHLAGRHPWYGIHTTRDGRGVAVGAVESHLYAALCRGLGLSDWVERQFPATEEGLDRSRLAFTGAIAALDRAELLARLDTVDACVSPVAEVREVAESDLAERRALRREPGGERLVRSPVRLGANALQPERSGAAVLEGAGFGAAEIADLVEAGVVVG